MDVGKVGRIAQNNLLQKRLRAKKKKKKRKHFCLKYLFRLSCHQYRISTGGKRPSRLDAVSECTKDVWKQKNYQKARFPNLNSAKWYHDG